MKPRIPFVVLGVLVGFMIARYRWPNQPLLEMASGLFTITVIVYYQYRYWSKRRQNG